MAEWQDQEEDGEEDECYAERESDNIEVTDLMKVNFLQASYIDIEFYPHPITFEPLASIEFCDGVDTFEGEFRGPCEIDFETGLSKGDYEFAQSELWGRVFAVVLDGPGVKDFIENVQASWGEVFLHVIARPMAVKKWDDGYNGSIKLEIIFQLRVPSDEGEDSIIDSLHTIALDSY